MAHRKKIHKSLDKQTRKEYHIGVAGKFSGLEGLEISSVNDTWIKIRDSVKVSAMRQQEFGNIEISPGLTRNAQN